MLLDLPVEMLLAIGEQLADQQDVKNFSEVSTYLYKIISPLLYERLTLWIKDEYALDDIDVKPFLQTRYTTNNLLRHTKQIHFRSKFHSNLSFRCVHGQDWDSDSEDHASFGGLAISLLPLLEGCRDNSLRSFSWVLGSCVPGEIMDYLSRKQTNIDSLVLVTDGSCAYNYDKSSGIDLSAFLCLRKLSWRASPSEHDMRALEVALKQVSHQLVELELDFVNKTEAQQNLHLDDDELDSFFTQHILGLPTASMARVFPAVQVLSLADISFKSVAQDWAHAFDFGLLRSLKLRFCDGWEDFLLHGIGLSRPTRLKSLEIQSTLANAIDAETSISEFLGSFQGLEQLIISNGSPSRTLEIWRAMVHHKSTLRVLVHHQRGVVLDEDSDYFEEECDDPSLSLELDGEEMFEWSKDDSQHPLSGFGLEFIGLCCHPGLLMTGVLGPLSTNRSLRILHIRQSGTDLKHFGWSLGIQNVYADTDSESDSPATGRSAQTESGDRNRALNVTKPLRDLAQWAFGPNGMPSLQVIAYGDFSYEGRYARSQVLLVRNARQGEAKHGVEGPFFRYIAPGDRWQKNLVHDYYDILAACPASRLLE